MDVQLSWNESDYNGIEEIRLPHDAVWKPVTVKPLERRIKILMQIYAI